MNVHSLGYRTDLIFSRFGGEVFDRGDYLVVRTPSNPTFHWGNFLLFDRPPGDGDYARWREIFAKEIGPYPEVRHLSFGIDSTDGDAGAVEQFQKAGFYLDRDLILTASAVRQPAKVNSDVTVRPLVTDMEWQEALKLYTLCFQGEHSEPGYSIFARRLQNQYRAMVDAGLGQWFGAFQSGQLAGALGLFTNDGIGRFQSVCTAPAFRRRGICSRMVYEAASFGLTEMGADRLVMAADPEYHAARIYESLGFRVTEKQVALGWWEQDEHEGE